ncbi:MAG: hypothetical protein JW745_02220 [Sedimentisphaerales bacterium]|nr:hypothetical protein [Sedimentisphaerales bacterium]MBN2843331.1 hypothetical protein [Sedimentisphaerales bacterium]
MQSIIKFAAETVIASLILVTGVSSLLGQDNAGPLVITIDPSATAQTIEGFGASDCWSGQYVGNWPAEKLSAMADLLFSTETKADGAAAGIGLSIWRFNLGAGSRHQQNIFDHWRAADCFLVQEGDSAGSYDWTRCSGQVKLLQAAKSRGVEHLVAFVNSPPYSMTKNGKAFCDPSVGSTNLDPDKRDAFVRYLAEVLDYFRDDLQIEFKSVSPINEPQWDWDENPHRKGFAQQEGCRYGNEDIKPVVDLLAAELVRRKLGTDIDITEAGDISFLYTEVVKGKQLSRFYDPASPEYMGDTVRGIVCGHSYWSDGPARLVTDRQALRQELDKYKVRYAQSEYSIIGEQPGMKGHRRDLGIDSALWVARVIHCDLAIANAVSWSWWLAISPYDYKDGLIYCDKNDTDGNYYHSKILWALGNYSRFIRPGMKRLELTRSDNKTPQQVLDDLLVSGYCRADGSEIVLVLVNFGQEPETVKLKLAQDASYTPGHSWQSYITAGNTPGVNDLSPGESYLPDANITLTPRSITTLVLTVLTPDGRNR